MRNREYIVLFGGFLFMLTLGEFYSSSNMQYNIYQYMLNQSLNNKNVNLSSIVWVAGSTIFGQGAAVTAGGFLGQKIGHQYTILTGGWFMSLNVALTYFTFHCNVVIVILTFGLFTGFGIGLAYGSVFAVPLSWFRKNTGLVIGVVGSGYGISSVIFGFIQNYINVHENKKFRLSFVIVAVVYAILQLIGSVLLKDYSDTEERVAAEDLRQSIISNEDLVNPIQQNLFKKKLDLEPHKVLQEFDFWILWMTFLMNSYCVILFLLLTNPYAKALQIDGYKSIYSILTGIFQFVGRICWGYLIDRKPYKKLMLIITIVTSIMIGTQNCIIFIPDKVSKTVFNCLWVSVLNFVLSSSFVIFPTICIKYFGRKHFICNYGLLFTACSVSGTIVCVIISQYTHPVYEEPSNFKFYRTVYTVGSAVSLVAAVLTLLFRGKSVIIYSY